MTRKSCQAEVRVKTTRRAARSIFLALSPDMKKLQGSGERLAMLHKGSSIIFNIESDDIASLRANVNSYLRLLDASHRCIGSSL
ncbi:MAG: KEOPS complex subunit Pcc1 [Nitrososphaera sp.]